MTREKVKRAAYTLEYKLEAVRLVTRRSSQGRHGEGTGHTDADVG